MIGATGDRLAGNVARTRINSELVPILKPGIPLRDCHRRGFWDIEGGLKLVPLRFAIGEMNCPLDVGIIGGQLANDITLRVEPIDAKARSLTL
jgi:hypothetical protein